MAEKDDSIIVKQEDQKKFDLDAHLAEAKEKSLEWRNKIAEICKNDSHLNIIILGSLAREEITENSDLEILLYGTYNPSYPIKRPLADSENTEDSERKMKRQKLDYSGSYQTQNNNNDHDNHTVPSNIRHHTAKQTVASIIDQLKNSSGFWTIVDNKLEELSSQAYSFDEMIKQYKEIFKIKKQSINDQRERLSRIGGLFDCYSLSSSISTKHFAKQVLQTIDKSNYDQLVQQDLEDYGIIEENIRKCQKLRDYAKKLAARKGEENEEVSLINLRDTNIQYILLEILGRSNKEELVSFCHPLAS